MSSRTKRAIGLLLSGFFSCSCKRGPSLTLHDSMLSLVEQIQQAQVIVLGTFESESPAGSIIDTEGDVLRLYRVKITVENILKCTALPGQVELVFYLY